MQFLIGVLVGVGLIVGFLAYVLDRAKKGPWSIM